ncbi:MAG: deoxynucleoside kinase [Gemmatimonadota bacterium]|nr:deoxynucleoside kinase [Gemmatimonadota bacterium]MDE3171635.1 deoxynucleoside kinase [Gemmatimonadota bacterium]
MLLGVAGMVGSGKTTLSRALAARFGLQLALESVGDDNPWLERFYDGPDGMRAFGLHLQLHFLATRFAAMRRMIGLGGSWVLDRTWYEDAEVFARGLFDQGYMSSDDWQLYQQLYAELLHAPAARPPRLLLYLHGPLDTILERIATRGRPKERDTATEYWRDLHARYDRWIAGFHHCPVLRLDVREYDLMGDPGAVEEVAARVGALLGDDLPQTELWPPAAAAGAAPANTVPRPVYH